MNYDLISVGATPVARPGVIGYNGGYCTKKRASHRLAPTGIAYMIRQKLGGLGYEF